ncbi:MAG: bifunctional hydroxymethylpyrimidine kinase/phosphomethylpyrimidine kinase, partial [candidate division Zixibacteria bacterium]|nr:bifunctional hydroxymethylpyrimidine kinase/phosphomethylpyrimidine kinase [candidate division Zixibacteria bacterium]
MITCVGNPVFDLIETRRIKSEGRVLSGCSTNACLALARLGVDTALVGRVGTDFDESFRRSMEQYGISYAVEESEKSGGFKLIYYDDQGNRTLDLLGDAGALGFFPEEYVDSDWILFGPILREIDLDYVKMITAKSSAKVFIDPQGFIRKGNSGRIEHEKTAEIEEIAALSTVFKPNEMECKVLTGIDPRLDYETPAKIIKSWGPELVIITLAELGSVIYDGNEFYRIPAYATDALDSTGAGDTYAAGIIYAL